MVILAQGVPVSPAITGGKRCHKLMHKRLLGRQSLSGLGVETVVAGRAGEYTTSLIVTREGSSFTDSRVGRITCVAVLIRYLSPCIRGRTGAVLGVVLRSRGSRQTGESI